MARTPEEIDDLIRELAHAEWNGLARTYGNSHATLIGMLVLWWTKSRPTRYAFEGGPCHGTRDTDGKGTGRGACDAILAENGSPSVVLEVEGTRYAETISKMGRYLKSSRSDLDGIHTAVMVAYSWKQPCPPADDLRMKMASLSEEHRGKHCILILIDKAMDENAAGLRLRNTYYRASLSRVTAVPFLDGTALTEVQLYGTAT